MARRGEAFGRGVQCTPWGYAPHSPPALQHANARHGRPAVQPQPNSRPPLQPRLIASPPPNPTPPPPHRHHPKSCWLWRCMMSATVAARAWPASLGASLERRWASRRSTYSTWCPLGNVHNPREFRQDVGNARHCYELFEEFMEANEANVLPLPPDTTKTRPRRKPGGRFAKGKQGHAACAPPGTSTTHVRAGVAVRRYPSIHGPIGRLVHTPAPLTE